jgi:hypothetical protein
MQIDSNIIFLVSENETHEETILYVFKSGPIQCFLYCLLYCLQHPASLIQQKKLDLLKEPCTVTWDVTWNEMMTMELVHAKESSMQSPPSRLIIHLRNWSQDSRLFDSKEITRVVKCHPGTQQAAEIRNAIQQAYDSYGNAAQVPFRTTVLIICHFACGEIVDLLSISRQNEPTCLSTCGETGCAWEVPSTEAICRCPRRGSIWYTCTDRRSSCSNIDIFWCFRRSCKSNNAGYHEEPSTTKSSFRGTCTEGHICL